MDPLQLFPLISGVLELAKKAPDFVRGKIFVSPDLARELGIVDCVRCSDEGLITLEGGDVKGCPDCDA
jgi:hypothetical protein